MSSSPSLPSPWKEFLTELDAKVEPVELHCIGGFVIRFCYGLYRVTGDIDYIRQVRPLFFLVPIAYYRRIDKRDESGTYTR